MRRNDIARGLFFTGMVAAVLAFATTVPFAETQSTHPDVAAAVGETAAANPAKTPAAPQPPVQISADQAEYFNKEGLIIFTGNVVAVQADTTLTAERMEISFEVPAAAAKPAAGIGTPATAQRITRIVAQNKVSFRQVDPETRKERFATGDKGVYELDQELVTMSGNPRLWEGKNVIVGEEMIFHLVEKKVIVKGKVNLTVLPEDLKEGKKP